MLILLGMNKYISRIYKQTVETLKYIVRSYPIIRKYVQKIDSLNDMNSEQIRDYYEKEFIKLFRLAYTKSPFYRKLYEEHGINIDDIKTLEDIKKLPIITKDMVRVNADEMLTVPKSKVFALHTSGTTGNPLKVYTNLKFTQIIGAYVYITRRDLGFVYGKDKLVSLRGHLNKEITDMYVGLSKTLYLSSYDINENSGIDYYHKINNFKPKAIEGYPSSLYSLSLVLSKLGLFLNIPIAFTSSETLYDYQRELIEKQLGTKIYDHYGMVEKTIYLTQRKEGDYYTEARGVSINEYVDDGIICTALINSAFPLIRYKVTDTVELDNIDGKQVVKRILGRVDDFITAKDGSILSRVDFCETAKHVLAIQWVQFKPGELLIYVVPDTGFDDEDRVYIYNNTEERVGKGNMDITIELKDIKDLIYMGDNNKKFKLIVNKSSQTKNINH